MLDDLNTQGRYTNLVIAAFERCIEELAFTIERSREMHAILTEPARFAQSLERLVSDELEKVSLSLAYDCALVYQELAVRSDPHKGDFLELATRGLLIDGFSSEQARHALIEILQEIRRLNLH